MPAITTARWAEAEAVSQEDGVGTVEKEDVPPEFTRKLLILTICAGFGGTLFAVMSKAV